MAHTTLQFGKVIWVEHSMLTCEIVGSVRSCAIHCLVPFFSLGIPLCHFFSVAQYFVAFESICSWQICDFFCDVVYFFRAHLSYNLFFPAHSASSSYSHFMCLCNIMNGCTLHLVFPPTLNSLSLSPPHFVCGWINLLVAKPAEKWLQKCWM